MHKELSWRSLLGVGMTIILIPHFTNALPRQLTPTDGVDFHY
ncbi:MAG: hypothetical protein O4803_02520 [Trichodesmium sp. St15_bin1_1]|jgi:hypothetical protein|nr:hypothetical protein [Trichodesmium sp. St5_bin2_1]MDE5084726.1 hypothetical protein [Trichodesmium sp. St18_bin1]MDE5113171.1 hypothetical protein [Trichodesmium sp. St15_bin1_1]MDE5123095.1 hypothetical protein [Trichodesmium sp. St19_bin1]